MWLPQTIIATSISPLAPGAVPSSAATGIPAYLPKVITPPNGTVEQPEGTSLIQIGFLAPLNYEFVVEHPYSSAQIFQYLPDGIAYGLGIQTSQVTMQSLVPLNTIASTGYTTTLAMAFVPTNLVNTLSMNLHAPSSPLYNNPSATITTLMNYINVAIPLTPGSTLSGSAVSGTGSGSQATSTSNGNSGVFNTNAQNTSSSVKGTTTGIAVGAIGAAAAYGAAMFFIARRYKKRKQAHRRSSSLTNASEMRHSGSPALLGGANAFMSGGRTTPGTGGHDRNSRGSGRSNGNSARTQQISAPMMPENSLGWN
jgi:hypothetical protein